MDITVAAPLASVLITNAMIYCGKSYISTYLPVMIADFIVQGSISSSEYWAAGVVGSVIGKDHAIGALAHQVAGGVARTAGWLCGSAIGPAAGQQLVMNTNAQLALHGLVTITVGIATRSLTRCLQSAQRQEAGNEPNYNQRKNRKRREKYKALRDDCSMAAAK